jgi:phage terminase large subunit-like protein
MPSKRLSAPPEHIPGIPPRPKGLERATRNAWNQLIEELAGKLYQDDGERLLELIQARADQYRGASERKEAGRKRAAELLAKLASREAIATPDPIPAPENGLVPSADLEGFLAAVKHERASFPQRLVPGQTVCLESPGQQFLWADDHPAAIARTYCLQATQGSAVVCDLTRRACARHLSDLGNGHERGLFYDPVAAKNICDWYRDFVGLALLDWEIFVLSSLFGWKRASGLRRFTEAWISVAKKNGKSQIAAGIGLFGLIADQEKFAAVYSAATKKDQARIVYGDACRAVHANPALLEYVREFKTGRLVVEETDSTFEPLSSDLRSMEGLRPSFIIADEIHVWENRSQWDALTKGVVSRSQPLIFAITTAGENKNSFAGTKYALAEKILTGVFNQDETFVVIYELDKQDSFEDESLWCKANPSLGVTIKPEALRKILAEALEDPSGRAAWLRYHANLWVTFRQGRSIPSDKWEACKGPDCWDGLAALEMRRKFLEENATTPCWAGLDLGEISDLTCFACIWPRCTVNGEDHEVMTVVPYFWIPEFGLLEKERQWGVPLSEWTRAGFIKLVEGDMTDPRIVKQDILGLIANGPGQLRSIGYDPWKAKVLCSEIAEETHMECVAVKQTPVELTAPCRALKDAIWQKRLWTLGNPVLKWMAGNLVIEPEGDSGGIRPKKLSPNEKIDGFSALVNAWGRLLAAPTSLAALANERWGGDNPRPIPMI